MSAPKRQALGRGLAALIPGAKPPEAPPAAGGRAGRDADGLRTVAIEEVHPCPGQPRKQFDDARLDELAASIKAQGIIQPLVVRLREAGGYELIAGERRWRAAQRAGLHEVPAVVRDVAEKRAFEMALVENLQREDLNPIEEAQGFERLIEEFGYTQEALAGRVGKDRSTVANSLRLLRLPTPVRALVTEGRLQMGHARALLGLESSEAIERLARRVVARDLSVRQVEALVKHEREGGPKAPAAPRAPSSSARDLGERLSRALGTRVRVVESGPGQGHLEVAYHSLDQLDAMLAKMLRP
ncbi:MAG TPA: ParB/RepB/Spo0J family partition protein [Polyangia bacterium]|nr:ParB/RepB/Spo0J family partition protein [Polyangia bacterium]